MPVDLPKTCPVCDIASDRRYAPEGNGASQLVSCQRCGVYEIPTALIKYLDKKKSEDPYASRRISYQIRTRQGREEPFTLGREHLTSFIEDTPLIDPAEQIDELVSYIGNSLAPDFHAEFEVGNRVQELVAILRCGSEEDVWRLLSECEKTSPSLVECEGRLRRGNYERPALARLTVTGWRRYRELGGSGLTLSSAFMAMQFWVPKDGPHYEVRAALEKCFKPAAKAAGYELLRLDDREQEGLLDDIMQARIRRARFVVADLTYGNPGVYWEAGFAKGLGKPVIYTCHEEWWHKEKPHFDVNHYQILRWSDIDDPGTRTRLQAIIENSVK